MLKGETDGKPGSRENKLHKVQMGKNGFREYSKTRALDFRKANVGE